MQRFTNLFIEIDRTKRTSEKVAAMERYFRDPTLTPEDAAWALFFLSGRKIKRLLTWRTLDDAIRAVTGLPGWLIGESYESVGDSAELMALLFPPQPREGAATNLSLHRLVQERMLALRSIALPDAHRDLIIRTWHDLDTDQRLIYNKLLTGNFRVGVTQTLVIRALAAAADVAPAVMAHRFAGAWEPTAGSYLQLIQGGSVGRAPPTTEGTEDQASTDGGQSPPHEGTATAHRDPSQPYPFYLAHQLDGPSEKLGDLGQWQLEWKYDGLRAQIIRRVPPLGSIIWSRGDELLSNSFPEIAHAAAELPADTVLDGEILAWENDRPLPFALLQRRINRKVVENALWTDVPVGFIAFDVLEEKGIDLREAPLVERRARLEQILGGLAGGSSIRMAPLLTASSWNQLAALRLQSRARHVEGVMLKKVDSPYRVGRKRGDWWKWKIDPYTVDAVLIYAQGGSGRRSGLFTDYTFGVWDHSESGGGRRELVPVAKAYSGLTDEEIREVDRFIRRNTLEKHGPVRVVKPELVFELAFEAIQESNRHKAGVAIRFPRMNRWRTDKKPEDADTLDTLRELLRSTLEGPATNIE